MLIIGGGMANTFLHAQGYAVGKSLCEPRFAETVEEIMSRAAETGCRIVLPTDAVVAKEFAPNAANAVYPVSAIPADGMILDIGPKSVADFGERIKSAKTLLWNGPVGAFEWDAFAGGTRALAEAIAASRPNSSIGAAGRHDRRRHEQVRRGRPDFLYLDRGRRVPRIPRGQDAAGRGHAGKLARGPDADRVLVRKSGRTTIPGASLP